MFHRKKMFRNHVALSQSRAQEEPVEIVDKTRIPTVPLFKQFMKEYPDFDIANPKHEFRWLCYKSLPYIRNLQIPDIIPTTSTLEAVLIEYRKFPHIEFTLRNAIHKLGSSWSYTIVCGTNNYDFVKTMAESIHPSIRVIQTAYDNLDMSLYSKYLASLDFWNMLHGEKILIFQEDSIIFRSGIESFLEWDYIGAPWPENHLNLPIQVGNGGFSLRTRQIMIDVINANNITTFNDDGKHTEWMLDTGSRVVPEDVYFTSVMQKYKIGKVAPEHIAERFSIENIYCENSFGGHNMWICNPQWKQQIFTTNVIQMNCPTFSKQSHRGGWNDVMRALTDAGLITDAPAPFEFIPMIETVYLWKSRPRPTKPWIGVVHCTPNTPDYYFDTCNISKLVTMPLFLSDIKSCRVLITLCDYVTDYLRTTLPPTIKIVTLRHPVTSDRIPPFSVDKWKYNPSKKLIQIGQQLRRVTSINRVELPDEYSRLWLTGNSSMALCTKIIEREKGVGRLPYPCKMYYTQTFEEYDKLLTQNIAFIDLFDSAANNTVLECITRNTPIILNRTPGVLEYLGSGYPLYFDNLSDVKFLLTADNIVLAHEYLKSMDKSRFTMKRFVQDVMEAVM